MRFLIAILQRLPLSKAGALGKVLGGIIALVLLGYYMGWWSKLGQAGGGWLWGILLLILVVVIAVVVLRLIPGYRERRFLEQAREGEEPVPEGEEADEQQLQTKMLEAIQTLQSSPELKKRGVLPLYALPWYLLIGARQSGKSTLLREIANFFSPFAPSSSVGDTPTRNCDWWFFNTAIILDTTGRYAFPAPESSDSTRWYRFLRLLQRHRNLLPINGMLIAVAADTLITRQTDELRRDATELRKRIDEAMRELGVDFPVYLLITRCDLLEGFSEFFGALPEHTLKQVFGYVNTKRPHQDDDSHPLPLSLPLEEIFATLSQRLQQLRLSLLNGEKLLPESLRQKVFCFPEEFRALQQPLKVFVETLLAENPYQYTPFFRGLFFCSAQQRGTPLSFLRRRLHIDGQPQPLAGTTKPYFLHDLFSVILPRDQHLARLTKKASRGRLLKQLLAFVGCLILLLLLVSYFTVAFQSDRRIYRSVDATRCEIAGEADPLRNLTQVDRCRQTIQQLLVQNRQRPWGSRWVFNRSGRLSRQLQQSFIEQVSTRLLPLLDARIEQDLLSGIESIPLVFLLIKRIELIDRCLAQGCPPPLKKTWHPDYRLMLDPVQPQALSPRYVTMLQQAYETYLHWAPVAPERAYQEREAHAQRLHRWFSSQEFAPQQILSWSNQHYPPITASAYWGGTAGGSSGSVEGAYTRDAWEQSIRPFLQRARDAVPNLTPLLEEFQKTYQEQYLTRWERFLATFPQGETSWRRTREQRRRLAFRLLEEDSPYNRVLDTAFEHLQPWLPPPSLTETKEETSPPSTNPLKRAWQALRRFMARLVSRQPPPAEEEGATPSPALKEIPAWLQVLQRYVNSESRQAYLGALQQLGQELSSGPLDEQSFQLAQAGFQERKPSQEATHPLLKAWWIVSRFQEEVGEGQQARAEVFWPLLRRPLIFVWSFILAEASALLQRNWSTDVIAPTRGLSRMEQLRFLYGPQGKVKEFVEQLVTPFLTEDASRPGRVLGVEMPLPATILEAIHNVKQLEPLLERQSPHQVRIEATRDSFIDSETNIFEEKTEFVLECATKTFRVTNRAQDLTAKSTTVFWSFESCGDVLISIFVTCDRSCVERASAVGITVPAVSSLRIIKRYTGQTAFLRFIQDFRDGSHLFRLNDFPETADILRRYRIKGIKVFYRVDVPSTLAKLISFIIQ